MRPVVSFVVPCYKLAHLLKECVDSILSQTYTNFEILILDDCSPDNTAAVAKSYTDPRVIYIRNNPNLGHLRNYNKGIKLARGVYIWLISADDYLTKPYILERYVALLETNPRIGYIFCAGTTLRRDVQTDIARWVANSRLLYGAKDRIISGRAMLRSLLQGNFVVAASGMARKECYEQISYFPLNMPWAGDWYLWSVFALYFDVAYFAEPMVFYREHELSMTNILMERNVNDCVAEDAAVAWAVKLKASQLNKRDIVKECRIAIAHIYARSMTKKWYKACTSTLSIDQFESSLLISTENNAERKQIRALVYNIIADHNHANGDHVLAGKYYSLSIRNNPWPIEVRVKHFLYFLGPPGVCLRNMVRVTAQRVQTFRQFLTS